MANPTFKPIYGWQLIVWYLRVFACVSSFHATRYFLVVVIFSLPPHKMTEIEAHHTRPKGRNVIRTYLVSCDSDPGPNSRLPLPSPIRFVSSCRFSFARRLQSFPLHSLPSTLDERMIQCLVPGGERLEVFYSPNVNATI